ncbi:hypothetical protein ACN38_g5188 [Penicillium nordicum]|uniref:Uncharacterized protein n=1 Tax=Penicillium nordicum TaxID=229535 RepID=A0A0M8P2P2_9EURO|nr:hypothetical protein ACN38_g5188 [Penicillium nordicum]
MDLRRTYKMISDPSHLGRNSGSISTCQIRKEPDPQPHSHKPATLEPLAADLVAVQTIDFRKVASLSYLILLFVGLYFLHICWVLPFTVLIRFFLD